MTEPEAKRLSQERLSACRALDENLGEKGPSLPKVRSNVTNLNLALKLQREREARHGR